MEMVGKCEDGKVGVLCFLDMMMVVVGLGFFSQYFVFKRMF